MNVSCITDRFLEILLVLESSFAIPSAPGLHLSEHGPVFNESHGEDLTLNVVTQEFISLDEQVVLYGLIFGNLVAAFLDLVRGFQGEILYGVNWQFPKGFLELIRAISPLFEGTPEVSLSVTGLIIGVSELVLNKLPNGSILSPSVPKQWQVLPVGILLDSHSDHVLLHEEVIV